MIPPVVASERGRAQTVWVVTHIRGSRTAPWHGDREGNCLERQTVEDDSSVPEAKSGLAVS